MPFLNQNQRILGKPETNQKIEKISQNIDIGCYNKHISIQ